MKDFRQLTLARRSVRAYTDEPVAPEALAYIVECARMAPSAVNRQPWRLYIVESDEARRKLQRCYDRAWFQTAPLYVMCCLRHDEAWMRADGKEHGDIDVAIMAEHICLAAADLGLGSCWVCNFDAALCRSLFGLAEDEEPVVLIPIGHPDPSGALRDQSRKAVTDIVVHL